MGYGIDKQVVPGSGSKWTGEDGSKYSQADGLDGQREQQNAAAAHLDKKSDGGLTTEPTKELPMTPAKGPKGTGKDTFAGSLKS